MSVNKMWDEINRYALKYSKCEFCLAKQGKWCVTANNKESVHLHADRTRPWQECWGAGYLQAEADERQRQEMRLRSMYKDRQVG